MGRKLLVFLSILTAALFLLSCGKTEEPPAMPDEEAIGRAEEVIGLYRDLYQAGDQAQMYIDQIGQQYPSIAKGFEDWKNLMEEIGGAKDVLGTTVTDRSPETVSAVTVVKGGVRNATIAFVFSKGGQYDSITQTAEYSFAEKIEKAGLNTLIGMATVFTVLILISIIISMFGLISKVQQAMEAPEEPTLAEKSMESIVSQIAEKEEALEEENLAGDEELVAVIAAAIAAFEGASDAGGFVVRSVRRVRRA